MRAAMNDGGGGGSLVLKNKYRPKQPNSLSHN